MQHLIAQQLGVMQRIHERVDALRAAQAWHLIRMPHVLTSRPKVQLELLWRRGHVGDVLQGELAHGELPECLVVPAVKGRTQQLPRRLLGLARLLSSRLPSELAPCSLICQLLLHFSRHVARRCTRRRRDEQRLRLGLR